MITAMDVVNAEWIKARLTGERGEKARLAEHVGVGSDIITKILNGKRRVQAAEVPLFVSFFEADVPAPYEVLDAEAAPPDNRALVDVYDISAAAGDGAVVDEYEMIASRLSFPPNYLRHITTTRPEKLAIISVTGGSMLPTLHHDDIVMVDMTKTNIAYDGMFVVRHEGLLKVKRLQWGSGRQTYMLISDNAALHPAEEHSVDDIEVVGRVVWVGAKQP